MLENAFALDVIRVQRGRFYYYPAGFDDVEDGLQDIPFVRKRSHFFSKGDSGDSTALNIQTLTLLLRLSLYLDGQDGSYWTIDLYLRA